MANHLFQIILMVGQFSFLLGEVHKYEYINMSKTWEEAKNYCQSNFTDLATVPNARFMKKLKEKTCPVEAWIGLSRKPSWTWRWSQPELVDYNLTWAKDEPNNQNGPENCARLDTEKGGPTGLKDVKCKKTHAFLCYDAKSDKLYYNDTELNWTDAQEQCRKNNTDLVSGPTQLRQAEKDFQEKQFWFGLFKDNWEWSDNSNSSYRNWETFCETKENELTCNGNCTVRQKSGKWKRTTCHETKPFICYKENVKLQMENLTWDEALQHCRRNNSDLVSIVTHDDELWIQEKARQATTDHIWLGLQYSCSLDLWFWLNDMISDEDLLESGERKCDTVVAMSREGKYKMVQKSDNKRYNFVCTVAS